MIESFQDSCFSVEDSKMKKYIKIVVMIVLFVIMLGGCTSDKDVRTYLQALLDASYKNDPTAFLDMDLGTEEEAQALYERGIQTGTDAFCAKLNVPDELRNDFQQIYMDMLSKVRYTVGTAQKQSDGSYVVAVTYEQMKVFMPVIAAYQESADELAQNWIASNTVPGEEEVAEEGIRALKECMEEVLADVQYEEPAEMTIRIELVDNVYTPNLEDVAALEKALFDTE